MKANKELAELLEEKYRRYNRLDFIASDPISIPHQYTKKQDIEIAGFLAATIAWGQRVTIIQNARKMMAVMGNQPHDYILNFVPGKKTYQVCQKIVHRTFNGDDFYFFLHALHSIYKEYDDLEALFASGLTNKDKDLMPALVKFRERFFALPHLDRSQKHFSNPAENSASKRLNMYLRWMVRKDKSGVDFGIWKSISPALLSCPLDVHSGNVARKLGLLQRKQNDWKATVELTEALKLFDPNDPVRYDFALFGLGVFEGFK